MTGGETVRALAEIMIPMHYGTFPLGNEELGEAVDRLLQEADRLGPSKHILIPEERVGIEW